MTAVRFRHIFVDTVPEQLAEAVIYISPKYSAAVHLCACGCGSEVVTPFNPTIGWTLVFDGKTVSLCPSIGNWRLPCKSHYFIRNSRVDWMLRMTDEDILAGKKSDMRARGKTLIADLNSEKKTLWEHLRFWERG